MLSLIVSHLYYVPFQFTCVFVSRIMMQIICLCSNIFVIPGHTFYGFMEILTKLVVSG